MSAQKKFSNSSKHYGGFKAGGYVDVNVSTRDLAEAAMGIAKGVASLINVEFKTRDTTSSTVTTNSGVLVHLTDIDQGDNYYERSGDSIKIKSVRTTLRMVQHSSASTTGIRAIWLMDTDSANGTSPAITGDNGVLANTSLETMPDVSGTRQFWILKDKTFVLQNDNRMRLFDYYRRLDAKCTFDGPTGSSDYDKNHLWLLLLGTEDTYTPTVHTYTRVRYLDN